MKIFIDSISGSIEEYEDGTIGNTLLQERDSHNFTIIVEKILTTSQFVQFVTGNDIVYTLSKKKQIVLTELIKEEQFKLKAKYG